MKIDSHFKKQEDLKLNGKRQLLDDNTKMTERLELSDIF